MGTWLATTRKGQRGEKDGARAKGERGNLVFAARRKGKARFKRKRTLQDQRQLANCPEENR
jgi:hypothetical protein